VTNAPPGEAATRIAHSRGFLNWLRQQNCSLMLTTYGTGQLFCVGVRKNGQMSFHQTGFGHVSGLWASSQSAWLAVRSVVWRFENALKEGERADHYDRMYQPRFTYVTGDLDIHELGVASRDRLVFVNTRYSCLAGPSATHNFKPLWKPEFISALAPDDRCHLNGLAIADGEPRYVTALGATDTAEGWRKNLGGGVLIDVATNRIVARDLWLPNSPRVHEGRIWLLESGRAQIVAIDPASGVKEDVSLCPGFPRGLAFYGPFAAVAVSLPRSTVGGLPLNTTLDERGAQRRCGVFIVDTRTGALIEWFDIAGQVTELFDVAFIPGFIAPMADGPLTPGLGSRHVFEPL
jgi:uncharacterized protein (TIGR03032 family)